MITRYLNYRVCSVLYDTNVCDKNVIHIEQHVLYIILYSHLGQALLMTACDLSATSKPWDMHRKTVDWLTEEFYKQVQLIPYME